MGFLGGIMLKNPPANVGGVGSLSQEVVLEKGKATHFQYFLVQEMSDGREMPNGEATGWLGVQK